MFSIVSSLAIVILASIVIMYACNSFDEASSYLGRNMPEGVKGATINAIGSSLPELLTTTCLLFLFHDKDGFSAGIATCAGSAVFNAIIIPAACILAVTWWGRKEIVGNSAQYTVLDHVAIDRRTIFRDGAFFIIAELALIYFLGNSVMVWWMGGALMLIYMGYFSYLMYQNFSNQSEKEKYEPVGPENKKEALRKFQASGKNRIRCGLKFDFNNAFFLGRAFNASRAWVVLSCSIAVIAVACYTLSEAVV
ncbi:MAG: hypothetical protein ACE5KG_04725, partial [Nitrososphaerales archaeon]